MCAVWVENGFLLLRHVSCGRVDCIVTDVRPSRARAQWVDAGSLRFVASLTEAQFVESQRLLLIVGWRDNEVSPVHATSVWLEALKRRCTMKLTRVPLRPLLPADAAELISDTLQLPPDCADVALLARVVDEKAAGVPVLVLHLLRMLQASGAIAQGADGAVAVDAAKVGLVEFSSGEAAFLLPRISALPANARQLLGIAACVGSQFKCVQARRCCA